jgi:hypothetical protein
MDKKDDALKWFDLVDRLLEKLEEDRNRDRDCIMEIKKDLTIIKVAMEGLKKDIYYRAGLVGMISAALPVAAGLILWLIKGGK